MGGAGVRAAAIEQSSVELPQVVERRHGREQMPPHPARLALDIALLVAGAGVGERRLEPVVGPHSGEELRLGRLVAAAAPGAGGVVEHYAVGDAPDVPEGVFEALADALRRHAGEQLAEPHVGERGAGCEEVHARARAAEQHVDVAEVGLGPAGRPHQLHIGHVRGPHLRLPLTDVPLHCAVAALVGRLRRQPLPDPLGSMALLAPYVPAGLRNGVDERLVGVQHRAAPRCRRHFGREVVHGQVLAHRGLGDARLPLNIRVGEPPSAHIAYTLDHRHADHPFFLLAG